MATFLTEHKFYEDTVIASTGHWGILTVNTVFTEVFKSEKKKIQQYISSVEVRQFLSYYFLNVLIEHFIKGSQSSKLVRNIH